MSSSSIQLPVFQAKVSNIQNAADSSSVYSNGQWSFKNSTALTSVTITDAGAVTLGPSGGVGAAHTVYTKDIWFRTDDATATNRSGIQVNLTNGASNRTADILFDPNGANGINVDYAILRAQQNGDFAFWTMGTERMRIDASGRVGINTPAGSNEQFSIKGYPSGYALTVYPTTGGVIAQIETDNTGTTPGISGTLRLAKNSATSRSINASGTINANGADYAEYMIKDGDFVISKGEICGVTSEGKLTKTFSEAITFVVKSTNPSYVGNDNWFTEQRPCDENEKELLKDSEEFKAWESRMEAARQLVDRIAFCGQVPVNVLGATPGQWIIPVEDNGGIKGEAVSSPSFEQYQKAVGKVIAVEEDGRARIIVKIA